MLAPTEDALHLPSGVTLGYTAEIAVGSRLIAQAAGNPNATLEVVGLRDGKSPLPLGSFQLRSGASVDGQGPRRIDVDVDLSGVARDVAQIALTAQGDGITLKLPRIAEPPGPAPQVDSGDQPPQHVLVFLIDTLRADKLRPYSPDTRVRTPALDQWVQHATVMKRARTQENWTKPSVATLLTGLMPWEHHAVTGEAVVPRTARMLSEHLKAKGYYTGAFIANGYVSDRFGFRRGWDTYRNYIREGRRTKAQYVADDVLAWLDARPKDKPFFLYVHTIDPHVPYRPPEHFIEMYDEGGYQGVVDFRRDATLLENIKIGKIRLNERDKTRLTALYDAEISYHDAHFGRVLDGLKARGLDNSTMVVVTADHGEEFWDHGSVGHGHSVWDELLHIPLMLRVPGMGKVPSALDHAVGLVDVMPTVLEALGEPLPEDLSGESLLPLLKNEAPLAPRVAVSGFMNGWRTLAVGRMKLVQRGYANVQLFDVETDPGEQQDLAPSRPLTVRYLRGLLGIALDQAGPAHRPQAPRPRHQAQTTTIDPETEAQLRALGYVGTSKR